jgi:RNA polymerase sigma-70 factor (ECF subfamily)
VVPHLFPPDDSLLARTAQGDRAAFETFYARHASRIMAFTYHLLGDRSAAEDATQETFVKVWRSAGRFRAGAPVEPWLYRIARHESYDVRSRRRPTLALDEQAERVAAADAAPTDGDLVQALRRGIDGLSDVLREAFVLVRILGRSQDEAARLLDVPVGTVKSRVAAAEIALRRTLGDVE